MPPFRPWSMTRNRFSYRNYRITPLARFEAQARVLSSKRYYLGREARLCPVDLALGWGPMSDETVLKQMKIRQSGRYYLWSTKTWPIRREQIVTNSANMHMIPGNPDLAARLKAVRTGQVVTFKGYLVKVEAKDRWRWISSLTRTDSGANSCELVWVEDLTVR